MLTSCCSHVKGLHTALFTALSHEGESPERCPQPPPLPWLFSAAGDQSELMVTFGKEGTKTGTKQALITPLSSPLCVCLPVGKTLSVLLSWNCSKSSRQSLVSREVRGVGHSVQRNVSQPRSCPVKPHLYQHQSCHLDSRFSDSNLPLSLSLKCFQS